MEYEDFKVTAIVTAGINVNAVRVGDPTTWHERAGTYFEVMSGTINILLHIDADLAPGALVNALVTCTEAKTAAVQELLAPSRYSHDWLPVPEQTVRSWSAIRSLGFI